MTPWETKPVFFDFETQSLCDLRKHGGRYYAADETTLIMSAVFLIDDVMHVWVPRGEINPEELYLKWPFDKLGGTPLTHIYSGPELPEPVREAATTGRIFIAHNTWAFDRHIWREKIGSPIPPFGDTLPLARAAGLGGSLERMSKALFEGAKDEGKIVLHKFMNTPDVIPPKGALSVITRYNIMDVALLARAWELIDVEIESDVLQAHYNVNDRGVGADWKLLTKIQQISDTSVARAADVIAEVTATPEHPEGVLNKTNLRSIKQVTAWLASHGLRIRDYTGKGTLRKEFVEQAIANPWLMLDENTPFEAIKNIPPHVFDVLRLRTACLRITGAKANKAAVRLVNGRIYDLFSYWQAHTGRWSSSGVQVHNLTRPKKGINILRLLELHQSGEWGFADPLDAEKAAGAQAMYDLILSTLPNDPKSKLSVDDAMSALLKPMFIPAPGNVFLIGDYNAIECRVLAWLADEKWLVQAFRDRIDPYKAMAAQVYGVEIKDVTDDMRQVGKVIILGCGYSMSAEKFAIFCGLNNVDLEKAGVTAEFCVEAYRTKHPHIAGHYSGENHGKTFRRGGLWNDYDAAAKAAVLTGESQVAGRCIFAFNGKTLTVRLPSGRKLRYHNARIEDRIPGYALRMGIEKYKATFVYDSADRGEQSMYGGKWAENISQAVARDIIAASLVRLDADPEIPPVMHVHDEDVSETENKDVATKLERFVKAMAEPPAWAEGLPLFVEGYAAPRYLKKPPEGWPIFEWAA